MRPSGDEKGSAVGLSQQAIEAEGSLTLGSTGKGGSSPDNDGTDRHCQTIRVRQARRESVREKPASTLLKSSTSSNLTDMGWVAMHAPPRGDSEAVLIVAVGRPRGKPAAYSWRCCRGIAGRFTRRSGHGERGNHPGVALPPAIQVGDGQARCRLTRPGWDGGPVVVRDRENRSHGQGGQQSAAEVLEDQEDTGEHRCVMAIAR